MAGHAVRDTFSSYFGIKPEKEDDETDEKTDEQIDDDIENN